EIEGCGVLVPISSGHWARSRVCPVQVASPSQGKNKTYRTKTHAHKLTPKENFVRPINLTVRSFNCGKKPEYLERTHTCKGRTCKLHAKLFQKLQIFLGEPCSCRVQEEES
ncbi:hypothetical protein CHARACLAT_014286, partial [Characodon lateralis]|nr:hypothetical protein [Characodon lateralis]